MPRKKAPKPIINYSVIDNSNKVSYLLLHLGVPVAYSLTSGKHLVAAKKAAKTLGIQLSTISVEIDNKNPSFPRYLFHFPYFQRNDELASRFADTVLIVASVTYGPFLDDKDDVSVFRIPMSLIGNRKSIHLGELIQLEESRAWEDKIADFDTVSLIGSEVQFSDRAVEMAWELTPLLFKDDRFLRAFRFLKASQDNFYVWSGEIDNAIENAHTTAKNVFHQSRLENALQDSFKAIEAILGDPPKDDKKFIRKIEAIGLNPNESFGLANKPLYQTIRDMNEARDKKAAHGSTSNRHISVGELLDYQYCARLIVIQASKSEIGTS